MSDELAFLRGNAFLERYCGRRCTRGDIFQAVERVLSDLEKKKNAL